MNAGKRPTRRATYQDVIDAPAHRVAEIIDGRLYVSPRPTDCAVVAEDLNAGAMVRNRCLARALSDAALGGFVAMLQYKRLQAGVPFHQADRWYPSTKTCSGCGAVQSLPLNVRTYRCACGLTLDRDINAARNLANLVAGSSPETVNGRGERVSQALPAVLGETSTRAAIASGLARSCQT